MTKKYQPREAGLTLVELLVVLALLSLLGGLAAAGLRAASGSWQQVVRHDADSEELLALDRMIRQLFSQIVPQRVDRLSQGTIRFGGASDRAEFLAPLPQRFGAEDIVLYSMSFPGDGTLRIAWQLDRESPSGRKSFVGAPMEEVFEGVSQGAFSFFGRAEGDEARWRGSWQSQQALPGLIRVRFVWRGRSEELIAAPLMTAGPCLIADSDLPCPN